MIMQGMTTTPIQSNPWVPLLRQRSKLVEFKKKGAINGKDLLTVRGPWGKRWTEQTLYFGQC